MHILMILEELNGKDFHQGGIITLVSGGGLVPENAFNGSALEDLLNAGVLGLKRFCRMNSKENTTPADPIQSVSPMKSADPITSALEAS
ncbi:unnamed protein product [Prunus armeniaca]|uniref:Uncharacterized protein n=1 Tax=Prunus armeniaca TaxID=36596 RepID=A0A6J5VF40_PRUAR|nr:unnamed protein product [Prunus armeniaca]